MPLPAIKKRILRCWVDLNATETVDEVLAGVIVAFNRAGVELQLAFGIGPESDEVLADISQFNSLLAKLWTSTAEYLEVTADYVDTSLTFAEWTARVSARGGFEKAAHAVFTFAAADLSFDLSGEDSLRLNLTLHGDTDDDAADKDAWARTTLIILDSGLPETTGTRAASNLIPGGATYDGSGHYSLTGLTVGRGYRWTDSGANDTSVTNGAETVTTSNAVFWAQATSVTLNGTAGQAVTAIVWYPSTFTADELIAYVGTLATNHWLSTPGSSPNGSKTASPGSIATDGAGAVWIKTSGIATNTGWEQRL